MAAQELVEYTEGFAESADQEVGQGEVHTLIPLFQGKPGRVVVKAKMADDNYVNLKNLTTRDVNWQIQGPIEYKVQVRNAGCDVDTGE